MDAYLVDSESADAMRLMQSIEETSNLQIYTCSWSFSIAFVSGKTSHLIDTDGATRYVIALFPKRRARAVLEDAGTAITPGRPIRACCVKAAYLRASEDVDCVLGGNADGLINQYMYVRNNEIKASHEFVLGERFGFGFGRLQ